MQIWAYQHGGMKGHAWHNHFEHIVLFNNGLVLDRDDGLEVCRRPLGPRGKVEELQDRGFNTRSEGTNLLKLRTTARTLAGDFAISILVVCRTIVLEFPG